MVNFATYSQMTQENWSSKNQYLGKLDGRYMYNGCCFCNFPTNWNRQLLKPSFKLQPLQVPTHFSAVFTANPMKTYPRSLSISSPSTRSYIPTTEGCEPYCSATTEGCEPYCSATTAPVGIPVRAMLPPPASLCSTPLVTACNSS